MPPNNTPDTSTEHLRTDPATLVAIARAAHLTGDRHLERAARRLLREQHGIEVTFRRPGKEAPHVS
jgi:hypothetical protein